jgi:hypothetical protein
MGLSHGYLTYSNLRKIIKEFSFGIKNKYILLTYTKKRVKKQAFLTTKKLTHQKTAIIRGG